MALTDKLKAIADAIRTKTGGTASLTMDEMATAISDIQSGGGEPPAKGFVPSEWNSSGYPTAGTIYGDIVPQYLCANRSGDGTDSAKPFPLKSVVFDNSNISSIYDYAFQGCPFETINLPDTIKIINNNAFYKCKKLSISELPKDLLNIYNSAFYDCSNLSITKLPDGLVSIGSSAFYNCSKININSIPSGCKTFYGNTFYGCTGLTTITFKGKPNAIKSNDFGGCTNLKTINVPWAEGEVANAPWGATNATINYNYTGE